MSNRGDVWGEMLFIFKIVKNFFNESCGFCFNYY